MSEKKIKIRNEREKLVKLRKLLRQLESRGHPYAQKMKDAGIRSDDIRTYDDITSLPFTSKSDLHEHFPLGWIGCDKKNVVRFHATSGTTGKPTVVTYTAQDMELWTSCMAKCLSMAEIDENDVLQNAFGYGLFSGGMGYHYGAERLMCGVIPASGGFTTRQVQIMQHLGTTVITCTPSYAIKLAEEIENATDKGVNLRIGIFGAEAWSEDLRKTLEARLGIKAYDLYGLSEAMGPGVAMECIYQCGMHVLDDVFIPEIVDMDTMEPLEAGKTGELVLTAVSKEAFPIIRYRTRDITHFLTGPCECGREEVRIARIEGRNDDMLIIRGVNVFPSQVEKAVCSVPGLSANYQIQTWRHGGMQEMRVICEHAPDAVLNEKLQRQGEKRIKDVLGVNVPLLIKEAGSMERFEGKGKRLIQLEEPPKD